MLALSEDRAPLLGRATEVEVLTGLLDDVERTGAALVLRGDPGIGKSRLLSEAVALAEEREMTVLATRGVQSEAQLAFGGLQQLLRPVRSQATRLTATHQAVLDAALGIGDDEPPERFRIAMAVLDLLSEAATDRPLLLVAEDAHWLDQPTVDVLSFVARRLESDPIVLLAAAREGYPTVFGAGELPELRLSRSIRSRRLACSRRAEITCPRGSAPASSGRLRAIRWHSSSYRRSPTDSTRAADAGPAPAHRASGAGIRGPRGGSTAGNAAAAPGRGAQRRREPGRGAGGRALVADQPVGVEALQPAADVAIVELDERTVRFRHPLMRSAVSQAAPIERRRRVHEALAEVLADEPDRRVWHRAALISGDARVGRRRSGAGRARARRRGATQVAVLALRRAADLSAPDRRISRLLGAAALAFELGQADVVGSLLREVEQLDPGPLERARITWIDEAVNTVVHIRRGARSAQSLIEIAEEAGRAGDSDLHIELLWLAALRASWFGMDPETSEILLAAAKRLGPADPDDPRLFISLRLRGSAGRPAGGDGQAPQRSSRTAPTAAMGCHHLGSAAFNVGAFELADVLVARNRRPAARAWTPRVSAAHADPPGDRVGPPGRLEHGDPGGRGGTPAGR